MVGIVLNKIAEKETVKSVFTDLGGLDGAKTEAKYSWLGWLPLITSETVLIVCGYTKLTFHKSIDICIKYHLCMSKKNIH